MVAYKVIEPTYAKDMGMGEFEAELNALAADGYRFVGTVPVREFDGGEVDDPVVLVVLERDKI